ncbi:MAG: ATP-binding cassette domain-containing protein [Candidatus Omnitrophota bacterium]|nr:ATP-binding cassette domain-containing protein [Candidatus Omnitrophota bacterium]
MVEVIDVKKYFYKKGFLFSRKGAVAKAVDGVSFFIKKGETFGLVGESGCGKSTIAKMLAGILRPDHGTVRIEGGVDMVFQDPFGSLNPRMTIREIVGESLYVRDEDRKEVSLKVRETLNTVRLDPSRSMMKYPHQFSGGERQRIAIARALIRRPEFIVLDEPVSSLDVSIQAEILDLLKDLQSKFSLTYLFISHDLRVVEFMSDIVGVMKDGVLVETAPAEDIYSRPEHEYTKHLLSSIPVI